MSTTVSSPGCLERRRPRGREIPGLCPQAARHVLVGMDDTTQPPASRSGKISAALARAERAVFTRPAPKSPRAQMK